MSWPRTRNSWPGSSHEVAAAKSVSGIFTASVVDADTAGPVPWLATAYVAGPSLAEAVREHGPLPVASARALAAGLAEGLAAIHAAGLVHRDLKPSNVLLAADGPRVIDFGISRAAEGTSLTHTGLVVGSPGFMSPEQAVGSKVGPPSDVFSLGAVIAFAAAGQAPFGDGTTSALVYRVVYAPPALDGVPEELRHVVERCLAKDPGERPTTAELLADLDGTDLAAGWLPEPIADGLARHVPPALPTDAGGLDRESQAAETGGPATVTVHKPSVPALPVTPGGRRPRRRAVTPADDSPCWRRSPHCSSWPPSAPRSPSTTVRRPPVTCPRRECPRRSVGVASVGVASVPAASVRVATVRVATVPVASVLVISAGVTSVGVITVCATSVGVTVCATSVRATSSAFGGGSFQLRCRYLRELGH